jgi:hypothetical protein
MGETGKMGSLGHGRRRRLDFRRFTDGEGAVVGLQGSWHRWDSDSGSSTGRDSPQKRAHGGMTRMEGVRW